MQTYVNRETLLQDLKLHTCKIHFTKVNGEKREMICTLLPENLPPQTNKTALEEAHKRPENQETIAVWDLQKFAWRSFRVDSVEYAEIVDGF
jgi:hypothetical protein